MCNCATYVKKNKTRTTLIIPLKSKFNLKGDHWWLFKLKKILFLIKKMFPTKGKKQWTKQKTVKF